MATKTLTVTEARKKFTEVIKDVESFMEQYVITRKGRPAAIILNADEFENMKETIRVMRDQAFQDTLKRARKDIHEGEVYSYEEIFGDTP